MHCCISIDMLSYEGTASLLLTVPATIELDEPGMINLVLYGQSDIDINAVIYACPNKGECCQNNLLVIDTIEVTQNTPTEIVISGTVKLNCTS